MVVGPEGCCGRCFPLEGTVAPGLHVILSQSCNSKASPKAKPLVFLKASSVCLVSRGETKQVKPMSWGIVPQGSSFVFSLKNKQLLETTVSPSQDGCLLL